MIREFVIATICAASLSIAGEAAATESGSAAGAAPFAFAESLSVVAVDDPGSASEVCRRRFGFRGHRRLILEPRVCQSAFVERAALARELASDETCYNRQVVRGRRRDWQCSTASLTAQN